MATTTPNFGWAVPTSTDLVKDGAVAIETLGDSIDASLVDLKGGTTGQVLAKASGTDMDFSWVAQDDSNAIQNAIVDAKGDLIGATAADTPARLAVGTNGQVLTADSTAATGLAWATPSGGSTNVAGKNGCLNSNFSIWQRGTTNVTTAQAYTADRWQKGGATHFGVSRQVTGDTTNLPNIQYCARVQRTASSAVTSNMDINQSFETINSIPFVGKTVTFSFYARAGANYSATSNLLNGTIYTGTGTDQNLIATYTGAATPISVNATLTTTWQRFSGSGTISSSATELAIYIQGTPTGTAGANDYYEVTGVQIEIASAASAYSPNAATFQGELAACQRYFQMIAEGNTAYIFNGNNWYAFDVRGVYTFPVQMRTAPTLVGTTGTNYYRVQYSTTTDDLNEIKMSSATVRNCLLLNDTQAAVTAGTPATVLTNNASASVAISAEL
jgi:hypothetical protein